MSNRYYDFLAGVFAEWFTRETVPAGSRYQLTMDSQAEVDGLYSSIKSAQTDGKYTVGEFDAHPDLDFKTPMLKIDGKAILLVKNDSDISLDFLVTLRNRIAQQDDIWKGKSIVFISSRVLDSINGGAMDISSDGGPFDSTKLARRLKSSINSSSLRDFEKVVLTSASSALEQSDVNLKLMDFADVYGIIEQGMIKDNDFARIGLFVDHTLATLTEESTQQQRIEQNRIAFQKIADIHTMPGAREEVENYLPDLPKARQAELADDSKWTHTEFEPVLKALDKKRHPGVTAKFDDAAFVQKQNGSVPIWHRVDGESKAKSRNHNIIAFVEQDGIAAYFKIILPFSAPVANKDFSTIVFGGKRNAGQFSQRNSGNNHIIEITMNPNQSVLAVKLKFVQNGVGTSRQAFKILVLRAPAQAFQMIRSQYVLNIKQSKATIQLSDTQDHLSFSTGPTKTKLVESHVDLTQPISVEDGFEYNFEHYQYDDSEVINFDLNVNDDVVCVEFVDEKGKTVPADPNQIDIDRRTIDESVTFSGVQQLNVREHSVYTREAHRVFLKLEQQLLDSPSFCVREKSDEVVDVELSLPDNIRSAIAEVKVAVAAAHTLPSLSNVYGNNETSKKLLNAYDHYIDSVQKEIESIDDNTILPQEKQDIARLGTVQRGQEVDYSPLAPMNLAYFVNTEQMIKNETVPFNVNKKLNAERLVPFLSHDDQILASATDDNAPHWVFYHNIKTTGTESGIADLVAHRIQDFISNFSYLFKVNPQFSLHVAVRNVVDHQYIFLGVINALIQQVVDSAGNKNPTLDSLRPIELYFADENNDSNAAENNQMIRNFFAANSLDYLTKIGADKITTSALNTYSKRDILLALQRNIKVYNGLHDNVEFHITFFQFDKKNNPDVTASENLEMNTELGGALSTHEYTEMNGWGSGFGTRNNRSVSEYAITDFAADWNALVAGTRQKNGTFQAGMTVFNSEDKLNDSSMDNVFQNSDWVTFIDPRLTVDAFNSLDNLYVIHYTDHDVTSNIDSITVTKRVDRYNQIIKETINKQTAKCSNFPKAKSDDMEQVISSFNLLNGVWLLEILNDRMKNENRTREKLSIIAAYKIIIGLIDSKNTFWVPISLEEILRISGGAKLSKRDSILDGEELQKLSSADDDLLFMGVELNEDDSITVRVAPAEIKIGENPSAVIEKAKSQVLATLHYLENELVRGQKFANDVARNFFVKLYLSNLRKLQATGGFGAKNYEKVLEVVDRLKNNQFHFTTGISDQYGEGFIVNFGKNNLYRGLEMLAGDESYHITEVKVPESDGYTIPLRPLGEVVSKIKSGAAGFDPANVVESDSQQATATEPWLQLRVRDVDKTPNPESLINKHTYDASYNSGSESEANSASHVAEDNASKKAVLDEAMVNDSGAEASSDDQTTLPKQTKPVMPRQEVPTGMASDLSKTAKPGSTTDIRDVRLPLGRAAGSTQVINWEYGNPGLANRHMLVSGKSGQGKTYFLQGVILEMAKRHVSSLVVDYTNSYVENQLDPTFKEKMAGKIQQIIVMKDGISLNPFKLGTVDLGLGVPTKERPEYMFERVAQIFDFVFNLGVQQRSLLVDAIGEEYAVYGEDLTLEELGAYLKANKDAQKLYGRIRLLLMPGIFKSDAESINWDKIFNDDGKLTIIQLVGLNSSVQSAITEFVLWNLVQFAQNSNEGTAKPVFLDEIQNLDFTDESPAVKILREGRKFGLSGIFATQSLASVRGEGKDAIWNAAMQMHFLPPEDQLIPLSKTISSNPSEREAVESQLRSLEKGEAILRGPILTSNGLSQQTERLNILQMDER